MVEPPARTIVFLMTDIEASSQHWEREPDAMRAALEIHDRLLHTVFVAQGGHIFKTTGDGCFADFTAIVQALQAAITAQHRLQAEAWATEQPLRVRMALHVGTPEEERDGDYFGPHVIRATRLLALGHGRQILLSRAAFLLLQDSASETSEVEDLAQVEYRELGIHALRGLQRPEQVYQVCAPGLPHAFPELRSETISEHNLPTALTRLVGREEQIAELEQLIQTGRLVTLHGAGGCGKTRLALEMGANLLPRFPDGVRFVPLDVLEDPELVPAAAAVALQVPEEAGNTLVSTLRTHLKSRRLLLILDNCEHLHDACVRLVRELVSASDDLHILATSREPLRIPGEHVCQVAPLSIPTDEVENDPQVLLQYESVRLFVERASEAGKFLFTPANAPHVAAICRHLDGIPLAIELAAQWVRALDPADIACELYDYLNEPFDAQFSGRQLTLQAAIDWSYNRLARAEQELLDRLSVFAGGFTLQAVRAVCEENETGGTTTARLLRTLVDKSLVQFDEEETGGLRYRLLEPIRRYVEQRLHASGQAGVWHRRHRDWYLGLAERADLALQAQDQTAWLNRLEGEFDNFRAAFAWSQEPAIRLRLALALNRFCYLRGHLTEGRTWLEGALEQTETSNPLRARALNAAGVLAWYQGDYEHAEQFYHACMVLREAAGEREGVAAVLNNLGLIAYAQNRCREATDFYERSLVVYRALNDTAKIALLLSNLGCAWMELGEHARAFACFEEGLALDQAQDNKYGVAFSLYNIGELAFMQGHNAQAKTHYITGLQLAWELQNWYLIALSLDALSGLALRSQEWERATLLLAATRTVYQRAGGTFSQTSRERRDAREKELRCHLNQVTFARAYQAGVLLTTEEAVALALGDSLPGEASSTALE